MKTSSGVLLQAVHQGRAYCCRSTFPPEPLFNSDGILLEERVARAFRPSMDDFVRGFKLIEAREFIPRGGDVWTFANKETFNMLNFIPWSELL